MNYLSFSRRWAAYLSTTTGLSSEKRIILTYVIEVLVINLINVLLALLLGLLLGVLPGTATCLLIAFLFRHSAGGAHSRSPWRCGIITVTVYPLIAVLSAYFSGFKQPYVDAFSIAASLFGLITVILLAPVDTPQAPIKSPLRRKNLKILSIIITLVLITLLLVLRKNNWSFAGQIQLCVAFSLIWVSSMLTELGHKFNLFLDDIRI